MSASLYFDIYVIRQYILHIVCQSQLSQSLRRGSVATCLLESWSWMPLGASMSVCCECYVLSESWHRTDLSYRGVLLSGVFKRVWPWSLGSLVALTEYGPNCHEKIYCLICHKVSRLKYAELYVCLMFHMGVVGLLVTLRVGYMCFKSNLMTLFLFGTIYICSTCFGY
jgi:hypothetical protein